MTPTKPPGQTEFVALIAMLFATVAFSIDAMLPALPQIAAELSPEQPNRAQLVLAAFVLGMGLGTLVMGPLSDAWGRRPVMLGAALLYSLAALVALVAPSLETVLAARLVQGLGASGPRVVALAIVRDLYKGREMARIVSFAMMIFTLVPAVAPLLGQAVMAQAGWRGIFVAFLCFSLVSMAWVWTRQPETLPPPARRPLTVSSLAAAFSEVLSHRVVRLSILAQSLAFGVLFGTIVSIQPIFETYLGAAEIFPLCFAAIALVSAGASFVNARLVVRLGMRRMVGTTFAVQPFLSAAALLALASGAVPEGIVLPVILAWLVGLFFMAGLTLGNLNALAMEPVGHVAGMAASVVGSLATVAGVSLAVPVGQLFDGTPYPLMVAAIVFSAAGWATVRAIGAPPPPQPSP
jgi:DHA1 family bicyclomycin/chloramphenicol resistance-like MFS transporter